MKKIAVYCGTNSGFNPVYETETIHLGKWLVNNQYELVYGGGVTGLMGVISDTVNKYDGHSIGIMPTFLVGKEGANKNVDEFFIVNDMHERKKRIIDLSDAFIALPGGAGTIEEISEAISWGRIGLHKKPCVFYNINGYYDLLQQQFDHMVKTGFLSQEDRDAVLFSNSLEDINTFLTHFNS